MDIEILNFLGVFIEESNIFNSPEYTLKSPEIIV